MASRGPEESNEARIQAARLEALRQEMMRRQVAEPEQRRSGGRGKVAGIRGGMLLVVLAVVLGALYALKLASRKAGLGR